MTQPNHTRHSDGSLQWSLEITQGQTDFPMRPIDEQRFLIGSGSSCDLQLGGEEIPILHSIAEPTASGLLIEAVVPTPELIINGQPCRSGQVKQGGTVAIGQFEFVAHCLQTRTSGSDETSTMTEYSPIREEATSSAESLRETVASLTASELLEQIERECQLVEEFEGPHAANVDLMLRAAEAAHQEQAAELPESVVEELSQLAAELESRTSQLADREAQFAHRAASLSQAQQDLLDQLDRLTEQLRHRAEDDEGEQRAIA